MAFRNLFVENAAHLSCKNQQLIINTDANYAVPIEDISAILIESRQSSITVSVLSTLALNGVAVYLCDEKHLPCAVLLPFSQHSRQQAVIDAQLANSPAANGRLWQQIVVAKIENQANCLQQCGKEDAAHFLSSRAKAVARADTGNQEATAAAFYFPALFEKGFTRSGDDGRNSALNYGYAILRGYIARTLAVYGFLPSKGLHHCSTLNQFNLADDIIEPYRPIVDLYVATNVSEDSVLAPPLKHNLLNLLQYEILSGAQRHSVSYAIERTVQSLVRCIVKDGKKLILPQLQPLKLHTYE